MEFRVRGKSSFLVAADTVNIVEPQRYNRAVLAFLRRVGSEK
jgi:hypothetical protein